MDQYKPGGSNLMAAEVTHSPGKWRPHMGDYRDARDNAGIILQFSNVCPFKWQRNAFGCPHCQYTSPEFYLLEVHIMADHSEKSERIEIIRGLRAGDAVKASVEVLTCDLCNENVTDVSTLMDHLIETHEKPIVKEYGSGIVLYRLNTGFTCAYCDKTFDRFVSLNTHVFDHSPKTACPVCGQLFSAERLKRHFQRNHEKPLSSPEPTSSPKLKVNPKFTEYDTRRNACIILECSNACPFKCLPNEFGCFYCTFASPNFNAFTDHMTEHPEKLGSKEILRRTRPGDKIKAHVRNLRCVLCQEQVKDLSTLLDHLVEEHKKQAAIKNDPGIIPYLLDKGFDCALCSSTYSTFVSLNKHVLEHYPKRACSDCGELISVKRLKQHILRIHGKTYQAKFVPNFVEDDPRRNTCIILEFSNVCPFKWLRNVFGCSYCSFKSPEFCNLKNHMSSHPDKSYRAEILRYTRPTDVFKADVSNLKCDLCQESVDNIPMLMDHLFQQHNKPLNLSNSTGIIPYLLNNEFTCAYCSESFDGFLTLNTHTLKHNISCKCPQCDQYFSSQERMRKHLVRGHATSPKIQLRSKLRQYDDARNNAFIILECSNACPFKWQKNVFRCTYCEFTSADFAEFRTHVNTKKCEVLRYAHPSEIVKADVSDLKCNLCEQAMNDLNSLLDHLGETHDKPIKKQYGSGIAPYCLSDGFKCAICGLNFELFTKLNIHLNEHDANHICSQCGQAFSNPKRLRYHQSLKHTKHKTPKVVKCTQCDDVFTSTSNRQKHMQWKHNRLIHKCPYCNERFKSYYYRIQHMNEQHGKKIEYPCRMCSRTFKSTAQRAQHTNFAHIRNKRFACSNCEYRCLTSTLLKKHIMRIHSEENK